MAPAWIPVESTAVAAVAYEDGELFVRYHGGGSYAYAAVPEHVFEALLAADSKGRFVNAQVKPRFTHRKL